MKRTEALRLSALAGVFISGALSALVLSGTAVTGQAPSAREAALQKAVDELQAKEAIRDQIHNYARGLDRMDKQLALQVWHPDGTADYLGQYKGLGAGFIDYAWRAHEKIMGHTHQMTNIIIKVDGDKAVSETYLIASLRSEPTAESSSTNLIRGRYADRWSKRNGRWAIDHRVMVVDFSTRDEGTGPNRKGFMRRDKTDPTYQVFPF
jgi:hypothetical protein